MNFLLVMCMECQIKKLDCKRLKSLLKPKSNLGLSFYPLKMAKEYVLITPNNICYHLLNLMNQRVVHLKSRVDLSPTSRGFKSPSGCNKNQFNSSANIYS